MVTKDDHDDDILDDTSSSDGDGMILLTKEGLEKIKVEYDFLMSVKRKEIAERLKEAISYGDLSENAEYEEAKNEQAFVEGRILELGQKIKNAKIISEKHVKKSKGRLVEIGSKISVQEKGGKHESVTFTIVGSTEADPVEHKISNESPIGKSLLGHSEGDVVEVIAPGGRHKYEITKIA